MIRLDNMKNDKTTLDTIRSYKKIENRKGNDIIRYYRRR